LFIFIKSVLKFILRFLINWSTASSLTETIENVIICSLCGRYLLVRIFYADSFILFPVIGEKWGIWCEDNVTSGGNGICEKKKGELVEQSTIASQLAMTSNSDVLLFCFINCECIDYLS